MRKERIKMKKHKIIIIMIISAVILIVVIFGLIWGNIYSLLPSNKNSAELIFNKDCKLLETVICYLENSEYESVYIYETMESGYMYVHSDRVKITDEAVVEAIDQLFRERGYSSIERTGNTICFVRWTRLMDFGSGIAYTISKEKEPELQFLTKIEPLSESGWYYYEEDYNEWRLK